MSTTPHPASDPAHPPNSKAAAGDTAPAPLPPPALRVRHISAAQTVALRHAVLWPDKPPAYVLLPEDDAGHHFGAFAAAAGGGTEFDRGAEREGPGVEAGAEDRAVAVISLFREPVPGSCRGGGHGGSVGSVDKDVPAARFRKFACDPEWRGRGVGTALLRHVVEAAREELGCRVLWCDARLETAGWYERRGLARFGETFWKGEVEYVRMLVRL